MRRRELLKNAIVAALLPAAPALDGLATPARALDLARGETIETALKQFFTATEAEHLESLGYMMYHPLLAPTGITADIRTTITERTLLAVSGTSRQTLFNVLYALQTEHLHKSPETTVFSCHTHTKAGTEAVFGKITAARIKNLAGLFMNIPSTADLNVTALDTVNIRAAELRAIDPSFDATATFRAVDLIFTNAGVYLTKKSELVRARNTHELSEKERAAREERWFQVNLAWVLFANSVLYKAPGRWDIVLGSPEYRQLQAYVLETFGVVLEFVPRHETTTARVSAFADNS